VREADLKADGYTFFGCNFISSRGITTAHSRCDPGGRTLV
jgi:hypothetical protein